MKLNAEPGILEYQAARRRSPQKPLRPLSSEQWPECTPTSHQQTSWVLNFVIVPLDHPTITHQASGEEPVSFAVSMA